MLERCAEAGGKIFTVYIVRSVPAALELIEQYLPQDRDAVVLHWFTGSKSEARRATTLGCHFSVNADMTRSDRGRSFVAGRGRCGHDGGKIERSLSPMPLKA
ncbi:TatD family hydrolase [Mesorhizobium neociceri]|uniref:TatD family hydrolase n=1 Tax=Mesorhizobium neociceri TaxID=1307853 RepID=UPI0038B40F1A